MTEQACPGNYSHVGSDGLSRCWGVVMESREPRTTAALRREEEEERRRRRAIFLRELAEARELRARIRPRRVRNERLRQMMRMRTFRY